MRKKRLFRGGLSLLMLLLVVLCLIRALPKEETTSWKEARQIVTAYAQKTGHDLSEWPKSLLQLLERNPETEDFVLSYPEEHDRSHDVDLSEYANAESVPLFLQWDKRWGYLPYGKDMAALTACGPVSLSMVAVYLTGDATLSPDRLIDFARKEGYCSPGNGSSWTLISEGAEKLGLTATELPLVKKRITDHLAAGDPIICVMGPGDFTATGHFIVLTGLEDGLLCVNDPNSRKNSEKRWAFEDISDQIRNLWVITA